MFYICSWKDLPCGGCHYCTRAHRQWGQFTDEVDDAVRLAGNSNHPAMGKSDLDGVACIKEVENAEFYLEPKQGEDTWEILENVNLLDTYTETEVTCLLDSVLTFDLMGVGGSDQHFDIGTSEDGQHYLSVCPVKEMETSNTESKCWGFTFQELQTEQAKDTDLQIIISWLQTKKNPDEGILFQSSPEAKYYWLNKELFQIIDGVLFKKNIDAEDMLLVIP